MHCWKRVGNMRIYSRIQGDRLTHEVQAWHRAILPDRMVCWQRLSPLQTTTYNAGQLGREEPLKL